MEMEASTEWAPAVPAAAAWAPGWYPVDTATMGWWTGSDWGGQYSPIPPVRSEEEAGAFSASFAWWGSLLVGFWPALIIFLTNNPNAPGTNRFARFSSGEALNVHLTVLCIVLPAYVLAVGSFVVSFGRTSSDGADPSPVVPLGFFAVWAVMMCVGLATSVVYVLAAVRAHRGVWWRARYAIPFLRAHRALAPAA